MLKLGRQVGLLNSGMRHQGYGGVREWGSAGMGECGNGGIRDVGNLHVICNVVTFISVNFLHFLNDCPQNCFLIAIHLYPPPFSQLFPLWKFLVLPLIITASNNSALLVHLILYHSNHDSYCTNNEN